MNERTIAVSALLAVSLALGCGSEAKKDPSATSASATTTTTALSSKPAGGTSAAPKESEKPATPPKPADPLAGFNKFTSAGGGYEVMMPGTPKEEEQSAPTAAGVMKLHMAMSELPNGAYFAQYTDMGNAPMDLDGAVTGMGITSPTVKTVKVLGKYDAREVEGTKQGVKVFAQIFAIDKKFFTLMTAGITDAAQVRAFWDSFKLTK